MAKATPSNADYADNIKIINGLMHAVMVFIFDNDGHLLLLKRSDNDRWEPVKGGVSQGENHLAAAKREVYEEAGIMLGKLDLFSKVKDEITTTDGVKPIDGRVFITRLERCQPQIALSEEHSAYKWLKIEEVKPNELYPDIAGKLFEQIKAKTAYLD